MIWWMLVLSGMVINCSSPVREVGRAAVTAQEPITLPLTRRPERVLPVGITSPTNPQDESVAADKQEEDAVQFYLGHVFQQLKSHKRYPSIMALSGLNGRVVLRFTVRRDGEVTDPQITEVTGHESFGNAALQALRRVGQLPPFPDEIRRHELLVEVPMTYRLSVSEDDAEATGAAARELLSSLSQANDETKAAMGQGSTLGHLAAMHRFTAKIRGLAEEGNVHAQNLFAALQRDYSELGGGFELGGEQQMETWHCFKLFDPNKATALITLIRMRIAGEYFMEDFMGEVSVAGATHLAQFQVAGLDRRWDWNCDEKTGCQHAFSISPDGTGRFYDFSISDDGRAKPRQVFECQLSP